MFWKIALYLRLSNDDGDKSESNSISSQRNIASNFVISNIQDGTIVDVFIDDGFTGTNFDRPDFKRMIKSIEDGNINCVVVKDLSRFGRDYINVGNYLEKYFPLHDVRFIAINDNYDSLSSSGNDDFIMPIKNIFNAQYSKDISKKVKSSFRSLQNEGKFVGAFTSYGYKKDPKDKHKLVIDEPAAIIVKKIFNLYISGQGKISIARILNADKIPCPTEYKKLNGLNYTNGQKLELTKYWTYSTVNRILKNQIYIGDMVQNKSIRKFVRGKAQQNTKDNWIIVEGTHEPIIDKHTWNLTQELLQKNTRQLDLNSNIGMFAGYIECGNCNRAMSKVAYNNIKTYICGTYKRYSKKLCYRNPIREDELEKIVLDKLNDQISKIDHFDEIKKDSLKNNYDKDIKKYKIMLNKIASRKKDIYEDYKDGILTKEEYLIYKEDYMKEEISINKQIQELDKESENIEEYNEWLQNINKYKHINKLSRELVSELLDKIIITHTGDEDCNDIEVKVIFKFKFI